MNLELLSASKDNLPDRVDASLSLPSSLSQPSSSKKKKLNKTTAVGVEGPDFSAKCVSFNRRGNYVAVGYSTGSVAVFDILSRTVCALYKKSDNLDGGGDFTTIPEETGRVFLSWSRKSKSLLAGSSGDKCVRLIDTTHPHGPEECVVEKKDEKDKEKDKGDEEPKLSLVAASADRKRSLEIMALFGSESNPTHLTGSRVLPTQQIKSANSSVIPEVDKEHFSVAHTSAKNSSVARFPVLSFEFSVPVAGSLQVHPKNTSAGVAVLEGGSLVAFYAPVNAWELVDGVNPAVKLVSITNDDEFSFTAASFDAYGEKVYGATSSGILVGFEVGSLYDRLAQDNENDIISPLKPGFTIQVPGGASVLQVLVNHKGDALILNCGDGMIRLFTTKDCWTTTEQSLKPKWVFQDSTNKLRFVSCDFSGNGKYVVAGANGADGKYYLFIWNTETGKLADKLDGAPSSISSVAWHPARSFIAAAAFDGLVDIWGPRVNWTAFAPSFEALAENSEYLECEDEFDIPSNENRKTHDDNVNTGENALVDVLTVEKIAAFASDSEDEEEVFSFDTKVKQKIGPNANVAKEG